MAQQREMSSSEFTDESDSLSPMANDQHRRETRPKRISNPKESIKTYVSNLLRRHGKGDEEEDEDLQRIQIEIDPKSRNYENISAFRQYRSNEEQTNRINTQRRQTSTLLTDDDDDDRTLPGEENSTSEQRFEDRGDQSLLGEFNLDPNPIIEQRQSAEQIYKQKVYLRQLQPPTPQPVEIQIQEVLLEKSPPKPPLEVRVAHREPRTPSPIVIKSNPPQPPPTQPDQPIVYNKYLPPPKQPPQQIIIHHHPDLPPKPRPIVIEQWLPYKPSPKRIIKHSLPPEARRTPPAPHNLILSYAKPRALIEVELVRLPIVKIDPQTYQQMTLAGATPRETEEQTQFPYEQDYLSSQRLTRAAQPVNQFDWRI